MPISLDDYKRSFHIIPHEVTYFDKDGKEQKTTLNAKHKPITQGWVNELRAIMRDVKKQAESLSKTADDLADREEELAKKNGEVPAEEKERLLAAIEDEKQKLETAAEEFSQRSQRRYGEHLSTALIDLDIRDNGKMVEPTADFLAELDLGFLEDIGNSILKKTKS